jgi:hypothetical protein
MAQLLRDRLSQQAARNLVGRTQEISHLLHLLIEQDTPVVFVHGIGGIGKSTLLEAFAVEAQTLGAVVIRLDCRTIKPSEAGFLHELNSAIGGDSTDVEQIALRLSQLGERVILALDTYEVFRMMDTWLRQVFIPALHENVRVIFSGREAPVAAWYTTPGWQGMFQSVLLGPLSNTDAEELLLRCSVAETDTQRVILFTHGHPLALKLAAATIAERPDLSLKEVESQHVVTELTELYLSDVTDPLARVTLEAASVLRRTTPSLLGAMLPDIALNDAYERLQALPFVDSASDGLIIHDLVQQAQQAIATRFRAADPERYYNYRRSAWNQLRSEFSVGSRATIWRYTADMIYLIDHPGIHEAFFPSDTHLYAVEQATPEDEAAICAITLRHDGPEMLNLIQHWWNLVPEAFFVARGRHSEVAGYYCLIHVQQLRNRLQFNDAITGLWWQHLQSNPIPDSQLALFSVRIIAAETGENPSAVQGSLWLDIKRTYMEYPQSRLVYTVFQPKLWIPVLSQAGFRHIDSIALDGKDYTTMVNDFGPQLVPGWMAGLVDTQLGISPSVVLNVESRELVVGNKRVGLTPLEFNLFHYLTQHEGKAVSRDELLNTVWGYDYDGGSNVVDAMMRSLRKKLGENASCIETVAGVGYKLRWSN